mmetsp:Transcript_15392/g.30123  ORF Transcript_15392/g.30123 Transcript_15392/m.30123 type:complete len:196 (-) Transcript_15392:220-807(-)
MWRDRSRLAVVVGLAVIFCSYTPQRPREAPELRGKRTTSKKIQKITSNRGKYSWRKSARNSNVTIRGLDARHSIKMLKRKQMRLEREERQREENDEDEDEDEDDDDSDDEESDDRVPQRLRRMKRKKKLKAKLEKNLRSRKKKPIRKVKSVFRPMSAFRATPRKKKPRTLTDIDMQKLSKAGFPGLEKIGNVQMM